MEKEDRLYGPLAKFVGQRKFLAEISSAGEAIRMLLANFPGLERHMADQHYKVIVDNYEADLDEIHYPASQTIKIVPVLGGAGGGTGKILAGIAIVAASIVFAPTIGGFLGLGAGAVTSGAAGTMAVITSITGAIGVSLILGGVAQMISPQQNMGALTSGREAARLESFTFSGIVNTSKQGLPVPVAYGRVFVGSAVISSGLDVNQTV